MLPLVFVQFPSTGPLMRIGQKYAVLDCRSISFHIQFCFSWLYFWCSHTHELVILPQFPSCRASLTFKLMPHANAVLDCSPVLAAGHYIRQIYQPIPASQFMDDLCAEEHAVSSHLEKPFVSIRSKLHSSCSTHVIHIQSYSDTWELPQNSPRVGKGHSEKDGCSVNLVVCPQEFYCSYLGNLGCRNLMATLLVIHRSEVSSQTLCRKLFLVRCSC
jgi:hypothetical protein